MARDKQTSAFVDGILRASLICGSLSIGILLPQLMKVIDPASRTALKKLDTKAREREVQRLITYVLRQRLLTDDYQHGISLTNHGEARLKNRDYETLTITRPKAWDRAWRLVFFDIPADKNVQRRLLTRKLRDLGFQPLQQSIWIYPHSCKAEVRFVSDKLAVNRYVTYVKTAHIDNEDKLISRFSKIIN